MKKSILLIIFLLLVGIILIGASCDKKQQEDKKTTEGHSYSCNKIETMSRCTDIMDSSYWGAQCGSDSIYSTEPCPASSVGGCKTDSGTRKEKTLWHYNYGGDPKTDNEIISFLRKNCEEMHNGQWVRFSN